MVRRTEVADDARRERLARSLAGHGFVLDPRVLDAIAKVPREFFVPSGMRRHAFDDSALAIGHGQTISAPHMVAIMATVLSPQPGDSVLEVGAGSGYHAAVLAHLVRPGGRVVSVEVVRALASRAAAALSDAGCPEVEVRVGDGALGAPDAAPFARVNVTAATPRIPPPLLDQLAPGGRLVAPVGTHECTLVSVEKTDAGLVRREHGTCLFVPLTGPHGSGTAARLS